MAYMESYREPGHPVQFRKDGGFMISKNNQLGNVEYFSPEYKIEFDLLILSARPSWNSVLHLTLGGNNGKYGDRNPGVWLFGGRRLFVSSAINGNKNEYTELTTLKLWQWYSIEITQRKPKYRRWKDIDDGKVWTKFKTNI